MCVFRYSPYNPYCEFNNEAPLVDAWQQKCSSWTGRPQDNLGSDLSKLIVSLIAIEWIDWRRPDVRPKLLSYIQKRVQRSHAVSSCAHGYAEGTYPSRSRSVCLDRLQPHFRSLRNWIRHFQHIPGGSVVDGTVLYRARDRCLMARLGVKKVYLVELTLPSFSRRDGRSDRIMVGKAKLSFFHDRCIRGCSIPRDPKLSVTADPIFLCCRPALLSVINIYHLRPFSR